MVIVRGCVMDVNDKKLCCERKEVLCYERNTGSLG